MCSPPWPSSTWLLRQRQVVGHYHCWHHLASCCKGENGRHNRSPGVTNSPSLSQWKAMMDKPPQDGLSASLLSTMAPRGTCSERTLWGLALFGWAGLSSTPFYSAVFITWTCILPKEEQNGAASAAPPEAMSPAMIVWYTIASWSRSHSSGLHLLSATVRKLRQCMSRKPIIEMMESREMGNALEIGKTHPTRSATSSGAFILVWFTAYFLF